MTGKSNLERTSFDWPPLQCCDPPLLCCRPSSRLMAQLRGRVGSFLTRKMQPQSIRQKHFTGAQGYGRQTFNLPSGYKRMCKRQGASPSGYPGFQRNMPETWHRHLEGDVQKSPERVWADTDRQDGVVAQWEARGRLQLQMTTQRQTYVCTRCGYPIRTRLVAIRDDNWDYRVCYQCYTSLVRNEQHNDGL